MIIFVWFCILVCLLCLIKIYEIVFGRGSAVLTRLRVGSVAPERLRNIGLDQPFSIFLPWRNPWNNFQVSSGNPCIKIIISTAHGTLAWSVSCRYNNPIVIVSAVLSREWYFSVDLFILANKFKKRCLFFFQSRSLAEPLATSRGTLVEKPWSRILFYVHSTEETVLLE
jgi:hypothetical protein